MEEKQAAEKEAAPPDVAQLAQQLEEFRTNNRELFNKNRQFEADAIALRNDIEALSAEKKALDEQAAEKNRGSETQESRIVGLEEARRLAVEEVAKEKKINKTNQIRAALVEALGDQGATMDAAGDAAQLALSDWDMDASGELEYKLNGKIVYSHATPGSNLLPPEWASQMREKKPYFFPPSRGDGAAAHGLSVLNGKPAVDGNDAVALGRYAAEIAAGKVEILDSGTDVQVNQGGRE